MFSLLGDGIFNADGENWKRQRKTASHIFSTRNFRNFIALVFQEEGLKLNSLIRNLADQKKSMNLQDLFFRFTLDSFSRYFPCFIKSYKIH